MYAPVLRRLVLGRLHFLWVGGRSSSIEALVSGSLLRSADETLHAEMG